MTDPFIQIYLNKPEFSSEESKRAFLQEQLKDVLDDNLITESILIIMMLEIDSDLEKIENHLLILKKRLTSSSFLFFKDQINIYKEFQQDKSKLNIFEDWQELYLKYSKKQNNLLVRDPALRMIRFFLNQKLKVFLSKDSSIKSLLLTSPTNEIRILGELV